MAKMGDFFFGRFLRKFWAKIGPKFQGPPRSGALEAGFGMVGKFGLLTKEAQISPKKGP